MSAPIVILGAGVIGLTTAVHLLDSPLFHEEHHPIHIIADHLPNDPLDAKYASTIAGAHHLSFASDDDERQRRWDKTTFRTMYDEWKALGEASGLMVLKQTELYVGTTKHLKIYEEHPNFTVLNPASITSTPVDHAIEFTSLTMTPAVYLNRLLKRLGESHVHIHRHHLQSLGSLSTAPIQALIGNVPPLAVVVCTGIGALTLGDVEDTSIYPTRGQVVKIRAPWVRSGWTRQVGDLEGHEGGQRTYVIPRPDGEVILGGTREIGDWYPYPREETKEDILRRALEICPLLRPAHHLACSLDGSLNISSLSLDSPLHGLVIDHLVGFRPSRTNGVRLERGEDVGTTAVIHNYGHGGAGWQSCWGTAEDAVRLLELVSI